MHITPKRLAIDDHNVHNKIDLIRLVYLDNKVVVDVKQNMPGRGVYILDNIESFNNKVIKNKLLNRAFRKEITDENLLEIKKYLGRKKI